MDTTSDSSCSTIAPYLVDHYGLAQSGKVRELECGTNRSYLVTSQEQQHVYRVYTVHDFYVRNPEACQYDPDLLAFLGEYKLLDRNPVERLDGKRSSMMGSATNTSANPPSTHPSSVPYPDLQADFTQVPDAVLSSASSRARSTLLGIPK